MEIAYSTDYFSDTYGLKNSIDIIFKMCNSIEVNINSIDDLKELDIIENKINKHSTFCIFKISDDILLKLDHWGLIYTLSKAISPWNYISLNASKIYNYRKLWIDAFSHQLCVIKDDLTIYKFVDIIESFESPRTQIGLTLNKTSDNFYTSINSSQFIYRINAIENLNSSIIESNSKIIICK